MPAFQDISGQKFGRLLVLGMAKERRSNGRIAWRCLCECGNITETPAADSLKYGRTKSCGCLARENAIASGIGDRRRKHGAYNTNLFSIWCGMLARVRNPNHHKYADYGGRGIGVHQSWLDFATFAKDMGERPSKEHSLERLDNSKGYEPGNVVWADRKTQGRNKRNNRFVIFQDEIIILAEAAARLGISNKSAAYLVESGKLKEVQRP